MMADLYEIDEQILDCVDSETGEIIDEQKLQDLQMQYDAKVEGIGCWIKNLLSEADGIKAEKDKLAERERVCRNKADRLKRYLQAALDGKYFSTSKIKITWRKSEAVVIDDPSEIPEKFYVYPDPTVNKTEVKKAIKSGEEVSGARLVGNNNIQIK